MDILIYSDGKNTSRNISLLKLFRSVFDYEKIVFAVAGEYAAGYESCEELLNIDVSIMKVTCDGNNYVRDVGIREYAMRCAGAYFAVWDINYLPVSRPALYENGHPYLDVYNDEVISHLVINSEIMREVISDDKSDIYALYIDYIFSKCPDMYVCREWKPFYDAGKFYDLNGINDEDLKWLGREYDELTFNPNDRLLPEYSYFFHNAEYMTKLLPSQVYDAIMLETSLGSGNDTNSEAAHEYSYSVLIEKEISKGRRIAICPFGSDGQAFKRVLNEKYNTKELFIVDDEADREEVRDSVLLLNTSELDENLVKNTTIIVNDSDYDKNINYVIKLYNCGLGARVVSVYGYAEVDMPSRRKFIESVRNLTEVKSVITDKGYVRIGDSNDDGYIMLDDFSSDMKAYSFGINKDVSWDKQMANDYGMDIYMYDHTIDGLPEDNVHFHYFQRGISGVDRPEEKVYSLETLIRNNGHEDNDNLILKIDVEGAEWDVLNNTPSEVFAKYRQIAFELHDFDHPEKEKDIISALVKLNKTHFPVWVHGNNHVSAMCVEDIVLPTALEILYLNKTYYRYEEAEVQFPWELDAPNTVLFPEYVLGNWGRRYSAGVNASDLYESIKLQLLNDDSFIGELKDKQLRLYSIFGSKDRIHLAPSAVMQNSLINTMSGEVYIGDNTFCGHNVSIITGTHDVRERNERRKDFASAGNDIEIGNGVWLCSDSTILGPCRIGNNAVVAAGSVVLPGTIIGEDELWAGTPAVYKKKI